ncbi:MAG: low molecular weight phosphotyrosine protein phosphatase, partial [Streptococcus sp.]
GNPVHQGTQKILRKYGVSFDSSKGSQQISQSDFEFFDLIVGMDESNVEDLLQVSAGRYDDKIKLFRPGGVPDPWYTGDFEETYNLVTAACQDWLQWIRDRQ